MEPLDKKRYLFSKTLPFRLSMPRIGDREAKFRRELGGEIRVSVGKEAAGLGSGDGRNGRPKYREIKETPVCRRRDAERKKEISEESKEAGMIGRFLAPEKKNLSRAGIRDKHCSTPLVIER